MRVRLYSHVGQLSGYGRAGRDLAMSLLAAGAELEVVPIGNVPMAEGKMAFEGYMPVASCIRPRGELAKPDVVIVHTLPMDCAALIADIGDDDAHCPWVAYTTWEARSPMPSTLDLGGYEQVWAPSRSAQTAMLAGGVLDDVRDIPHAFDPEGWPRDPEGWPRDHGLMPSPYFTFYYVGAWTGRKNVAGLLRAWAMAFTAADEVRLYLQCTGTPMETFGVALHQTGLRAQDMAPVRFTNEPVSSFEIWELHNSCDVFVTATRGEAWNLPAFDAMLAGRHVICPAGMGSDDFLRETSADFYGGMAAPASVDVRVTSDISGGLNMQVVGAQGLTSRSVWIEPDLRRLAEAMRNAYLGRCRDLIMKYDPVERFSYAAVGKRAMTALEDL